MIRAVRALTGAAGLLLAAACTVVREPPPLTSPGPVDRPEAVLSRLVAGQAGVTSVRGLASVHYDGPAGSGSVDQVIVVALPDRARLETVSPVGTTLFVLAILGEDLRVHSPVRHEYGAGRATRETLGRLVRAPIPPGPLLRLLAGLPPLTLRPGDPRVGLAVEGAAVRVESVEGPFWQRLWADPQAAVVDRGELGETTGLLLRFQFGERRPLGGGTFPFAIDIQEVTAGARLTIRYETVRLNVPVEAALFEIPQPANGRTRIFDLEGGTPP